MHICIYIYNYFINYYNKKKYIYIYKIINNIFFANKVSIFDEYSLVSRRGYLMRVSTGFGYKACCCQSPESL